MKLTKGRINKLLNVKNQSMKKYKGNKKYNRTNTFRKKRPLDLNNKTLKNIFMLGGVRKNEFNGNDDDDNDAIGDDSEEPITEDMFVINLENDTAEFNNNEVSGSIVPLKIDYSFLPKLNKLNENGEVVEDEEENGKNEDESEDENGDKIFDKYTGLNRGSVYKSYSPNLIKPRKKIIEFGKMPIKIDIDNKPLGDITAALERYLSILIANKLRELIPSGPQDGIQSSAAFLDKLKNSMTNKPTIDMDILNKLGLKFNIGEGSPNLEQPLFDQTSSSEQPSIGQPTSSLPIIKSLNTLDKTLKNKQSEIEIENEKEELDKLRQFFEEEPLKGQKETQPQPQTQEPILRSKLKDYTNENQINYLNNLQSEFGNKNENQFNTRSKRIVEEKKIKEKRDILSDQFFENFNKQLKEIKISPEDFIKIFNGNDTSTIPGFNSLTQPQTEILNDLLDSIQGNSRNTTNIFKNKVKKMNK